ncbi:MAG: type II toxin-antitoxin system HipA family toxin [Candidatus Sabulitectum sp.]|nr:type II toxin-antitoxin system HipA family toxin [Candidatus Sabulitectum sp.]
MTMPESDSLNVYFENFEVGVINADERSRMSFHYSSSWLSNPDAFQISITMPFTKNVYPTEIAHSFFANLLPEGLLRENVARALSVSPDNDFELIARIGGECAGALWIGNGKPLFSDEQMYSLVSNDELYRRITDGNVFSSVLGSKKVRLSLAGAQDKLPVRLEGEQIMLPGDGCPSTHIMKFPSRDYRDLPANEVFVTSLAKHIGIRTVDAWIFKIGEIETCMVSRYDRFTDGEKRIRRLHQEDICQASGFPHYKKYESEGGPSFKECFELVHRVCTEPILERDQLLKWLVFNLLIGNSDAHAKNLSILFHPDGKVELAPFYDLVCTMSYAGLNREMAMSIGSVSDPGRIGPKHFDSLAGECGFSPKWLRGFVLNMAERVSVVLDVELDRLRMEQSVQQRVLPAIRKQTRNIRNSFRQAVGIGPDEKVKVP